MSNKALGFLGAGLLIVGLFLPIATFPFLGNVTLMSQGFSVIATGLLLLALLSAYLVWGERHGALIWTGGAALLTVVYMFGRLQWSMMQMRTNLTEELEGNPFAGLAQTAMASVGLQWGWLILATGPSVLIYLALQERRAEGVALLAVDDTVERIAAAVSILILLIAPAQDAWSMISSSEESASPVASNSSLPTAEPEASSTPSVDEARYINNNLRLYEFEAKYFDSVLDGRVPGVDFKIKNDGDRTIENLTVKVVFFDSNDQPIAEELYYPVNVGGFNFGNEDRPLRPNYIWQQESGQFYAAKMVPSEWEEGNARASITDVEFGSGN